MGILAYKALIHFLLKYHFSKTVFEFIYFSKFTNLGINIL